MNAAAPGAGTMPAIRILPDLLVNKIAAGEVVERPASVVKELIENALDARATRIAVTIEDGGRQLIRVVDDGCGMSPEDVRLAVHPHATSKIATEDDLFAISTLGFRGEALPSIGAVSRLRLISRQADAVEGAEVRVSGDVVESSQAAGCPVGTTVEVAELFFNTPARRKFLKAASTETGHVTEQFIRAALSHLDTAFALTSGGRVLHNLPAHKTLSDRAAVFYGPELAEELMAVHRDERGVGIDAYAAPPARARATAAWQYIYLNGRYIRDRTIQHAVREAYRGLIEQGRYPVIFLFLTVDPAEVDVNVHPSKLEVRWRDSHAVYSQVLSALREKFLRTDLTPVLRAGASATAQEQWHTDAAADEVQADELRHRAAEFFKSLAPGIPEKPAFDAAPPSRTDENGGRDRVSSSPYRAAPAFERDRAAAGDPTAVWRTFPTGDGPAPPGPRLDRDFDPRPDHPRPPPPRAIQLHNAYLVCETEDGLVIIDQHALHERILYDTLRRRIAEGPLESQRLLLPETVDVTPEQSALLEEHGELLSTLGLDVSPFGPASVAVHGIPSIIRDRDAAALVRDVIDRLADEAGRTDTDAMVHGILDMMACKAAVKAGDALAPEEIAELVAHKELVEKSSNCPHGRPTTLRWTVRDLERQFKRT